MPDDWGIERSDEHIQWTPDLRARIVKAGFSLLPFTGSSILGDWLADRIGGQRSERYDALFEEIGARLSDLEEHHYERMETPRVLDVLEDAVAGASRALTKERIGYIAQVVANGIKGSDPKLEEEKLVLRLLAQLSDEQIVMLYDITYLSNDVHRQRAFRELHSNIRMASMNTFTKFEKEAIIVQSDRVRGLIDLGLVRGGEGFSDAGGGSILNVMVSHGKSMLAYWFLERIGLSEGIAPPVETPLL